MMRMLRKDGTGELLRLEPLMKDSPMKTGYGVQKTTEGYEAYVILFTDDGRKRQVLKVCGTEQEAEGIVRDKINERLLDRSSNRL